MDALKVITDGMIKEERPHIKVGDVVKVHVKIREGERERIQVFEGTIIARKVRRSKLYYLRDRVGKAAKVKERI